MDKVLLTIENGQAWLKINREDKRNAIDYEVMELFAEKLAIVESNDDVKVLIITGEGNNAFCSGGDLTVFHSIYTKEEAEKMLTKMAKVLLKLFFFPKPTVAFLNGTAVGGGCEVASACDYRIAEKNIKFGFVQGKLGITTGWGGSTYLLERIKPLKAMELLINSAIFDAKEGVEIGFIDSIYSKEQFDNWLSSFTMHPLGVILAYKQRFLGKYDKDLIERRVIEEIDGCSTLWETDEHHEAVTRFINK